MTQATRRREVLQLLLGAAATSIGTPAFASKQPSLSSPLPLEKRLLALKASLPNYAGFPTLAAIRARAAARLRAYPQRMKVTPLGKSRMGEPIELVSISGGSRSALMIAGLHANEPVGGLTADFLMDQLLTNPALRDGMGYTWHFISPVDPDGMRRNEGWFSEPIEPTRYFHDFYRPPMARQPEYTFPLHIGPVNFDASTPENLAWQKALDLVKPDFQYTSHNSEYGGAFFLTSRTDAQLDTSLSALPSRFGLTVNRIAEPFSPITDQRSAGVFTLPSPREVIERAMQSNGKIDPKSVWDVGASSTDYAVERWGTVSFSVEVPLWDDARAFDQTPSKVTLSEIASGYLADAKEAAAILTRWRDKIPTEAQDRSELAYSLRDYLNIGLSDVDSAQRLAAPGALPDTALTVSDVAHHVVYLRLLSVRPLAVLARTARMPNSPIPPEAGAEAQGFVNRQIERAQEPGHFRDIPLRDVVGVQALAGLMAAEAAKRKG